MRIGHGYDLHRLQPDSGIEQRSTSSLQAARPLLLGGFQIPQAEPVLLVVAHSDGDVLLHALVDALMGAIAGPDIGQLFPDSSPENAGRRSADFVSEAASRVAKAGFEIGNIDATVILQRPRIAPYRDAIRRSIAALLDIPENRVNVKGKSHESVDAVGEGRAVEAHVVALLTPK